MYYTCSSSSSSSGSGSNSANNMRRPEGGRRSRERRFVDEAHALTYKSNRGEGYAEEGHVPKRKKRNKELEIVFDPESHRCVEGGIGGGGGGGGGGERRGREPYDERGWERGDVGLF